MNNQSLISDKLVTPLINMDTSNMSSSGSSTNVTPATDRDSISASLEESQEISQTIANNQKNSLNSHNNNNMYHRQHNFNNRDMELSLGESDEDDDDEDDDEEDEEGDEDDEDEQQRLQHQHQQMHQQRMEIRHQEGDYGDIQFFHHKLLLQQHLGHNEFSIGSGGVSSFGSANGLVNIRGSGSGSSISATGSGVDSFHIEECDDDDNGISNSFSENPFVFPDNVMEYGEPQFFPGNCVGYLETILEETDEEFEEEEGCSGRHWWTADSDTDTDSVIRVDNGQNHQFSHQHHHHQHQQLNNNSNVINTSNQSTVPSHGPQGPSGSSNTASATGLLGVGGTSTNLKSVENVEDLSVQSTFRSSASSRPFELEDLHLLDQLDLAFEETLMEPRRRSGIAAFGHQLHLLDQPFETNSKGRGDERRSAGSNLHSDIIRGAPLQRSASHDGERSKVFLDDDDDVFSNNYVNKSQPAPLTRGELIQYENVQLNPTKNGEDGKLGNAESKETFGSSLSPSSSDSEPHEVAEEDFFYSSPGSESEEGSSSSDDSEKTGGVVLAEFSLSQGGGGGSIGGLLGSANSFNSGSFGSARNRRSFESSSSSAASSASASSRLKSFRSFDSLNALSGTELLFSKSDTFPSFHYIKEDVEPGSSGGSGSPSSPRCNLTSSSTNDVPGASTGRETSGNADDGEDESQSLPSHHSVVVAEFPPTFNKITKKNSYSSSTSTASSSSTSASGMMSTENLSEDSGIGPDGVTPTGSGPIAITVTTNTTTAFTNHPTLEGKQSSESFSDEGAYEHNQQEHEIQQEGESAKEYIAKSEFALNPLVFSSLSSSSDVSSNNPSMNSVPSLNNHEDGDLELPSTNNITHLESANNTKVMEKAGESIVPIYPNGNSNGNAGNNDTALCNNSLSNSHSKQMDKNSMSTTTITTTTTTTYTSEIPEEIHILERNYHYTDEGQKGSNQIVGNPLDEKCSISINETSSATNDAYSKTRNSHIDTDIPIKEVGLHPFSDLQIQAKQSLSISDTADEAKTPHCTASPATITNNDDNKSFGDNPSDNLNPHNSIPTTRDSLVEKTVRNPNTIVPLIPSRQLPSSSSPTVSLALTSTFTDKSDYEEKQQRQQQSSIKPDLVLVGPEIITKTTDNTNNTDTKNYLGKNLDSNTDSHNSIVNESINEDVRRSGVYSGVISASAQEHPIVGVDDHSHIVSGVPYIEENNEIQDNLIRKEEWNANANERQLSSSQSQIQRHTQPSPPPPSYASAISSTQNSQQWVEFHKLSSQTSNSSTSTSTSDSDSDSNVNKEITQLDQYKTHQNQNPSETYAHRPYRRERSNSESEFESAESAVEEDSIALAYAIVNSPTKGSLSSSPTQDLLTNSPTIINAMDHDINNIIHVNSLVRDGKSGTVTSTLTSLPMLKDNASENANHSKGNGGNGMRQEKGDHHNVIMDTDLDITTDSSQVFASPSSILDDDGGRSSDASNNMQTSPQAQSNSQDGQNVANVHNNTGNNSTEGIQKADIPMKMENASNSLHHHDDQPHQKKNQVPAIPQPEEESHSHNDNTNANNDDQPNSFGNSNSTMKITYQVQQQHQEAVGHEYEEFSNNITDTHVDAHHDDHYNKACKPSRSVTLENSSSTDVVHQHHQHRNPNGRNQSQEELDCRIVDKHNHITQDHNTPVNQVDCIASNRVKRDEEKGEGLVIAKPIDPVHIGVAEVKKFTQLDSSVSRKPYQHQHYNHQTLLGDSVSDSSEHIQAAPGINSSGSISSSVKTDTAILGHSNFGFFGRTASAALAGNSSNKHLSPSIVNLELKKSVVGSSTAGIPTSTIKSNTTTESSELSSYGFPPSPGTTASSYPISPKDLHLHESLPKEGVEIPAPSSSHSVSSSGSANRRNRDQPKDQHHKKQQGVHLHLEDIKCGIHPENFTIPLGVYSAAVIATAPSIPSKRLVFVNEGEDHLIRIHEQQPSYSSSSIQEKVGTTSTFSSPTSINIIRGNQSSINTNTSQSNPSSNRAETTPGILVPCVNPDNNVSSTKSSNPPDILVVKQTHLVERRNSNGNSSGGGDTEETHTSSRIDKHSTNSTSMEVDTPASTRHGDGGADRRSTSPSGGIPIKTRTYGPRNEVEVVLVSSRTPSPAPLPVASFPSSSSLKQQPYQYQFSAAHGAFSASSGDEGNNDGKDPEDAPISGDQPAVAAKIPRTRVHFSPVVSEISWRESYIDQSSEFSGSTDDMLARLAEVANNQSDFNNKTTTGASTIPSFSSRDSAGSGSGYFVDNNEDVTDSVVRPLQISADRRSNSREKDIMAHYHQDRQQSPGSASTGSGKGPILVEKVQMRSSFLHGGDDDDEDDEELERKLTMNVRSSNDSGISGGHGAYNKLPVDADHEDYEDTDLQEPHKENIEFRSGSATNRKLTVDDRHSGCSSNGILDLYEDVNVQIEPINKKSGSTTLSMVPDLLSQCENANNIQTHIDVRIEEVESLPTHKNKSKSSSMMPKPFRKSHSPIPQQSQGQSSSEIPLPPLRVESSSESLLQEHQKQIFPKIFAEESSSKGNGSSGGKGNDSKNNSSSSLNKSGKKSSKGFSLGKKSGENAKEKLEKDNKDKDASTGNKETESSKENKSKSSNNTSSSGGSSSKPGFFERLSKIRLSGSKPKKQKVHPKTDEIDQAAAKSSSQPLRTANTVNVNGNSGNNTTNTNGAAEKGNNKTILKKAPANSPTPVIPNYTMEYDPDEDECHHHEAFESILQEIAGIKTIKMRMESQKSSNEGTPTHTERSSGTTTPQQAPVKELRSFAKRKQFYNTDSTSPSPPPVSPNGRSYSDLDKKLSQFKEETSKTRDAVSKSHPDLELIEDVVRQQSASPEPPKSKNIKSSSSTTSATLTKDKDKESKKSPKKSSASETGQKNEREWYKLLKSAAEKYYYRGSNKDDTNGSSTDIKTQKSSTPATTPEVTATTSIKTGIVETDLDTGASREMLDAEIVVLDKVPSYTVSTSEIPSATSTTPITTTAASPGTAAKARSLTNLSTRLPLSVAPSNYNEDDPLAQGDLNDFDERAKSYEFLLDDNQKSSSVPPENKLRLETRQLSEHELRIQRSLQRLNVPEWFKKHETSSGTSTPAPDGLSSSTTTTTTESKPGNLKIVSRRSEYGSSGGLAGGWAGLSAFKAPSMSSLQSSNGGRYSGSLNRSNFVRGRPATMSATRLSKESLVGTGSASHSPSAFDRCSFTYGMPFAMTRFGHGRMSTNSGSVTPNSTPDSSLTTTTTTTSTAFVKKPYLGWRSQERLNLSATTGATGAPKLSVYLPPEERLAADILKTKVPIRPPLSDRPPLPKPPPRSDKTALTKTESTDNQSSTSPSSDNTTTTTTNISSVAVVTKINQNSIPPPNFSDDEQSISREKSSDVHDSIREVTKAISQFVAKGEEGPPKPQPRKKPSGKKSIWMESSFVGRKPVSK